MSNDFTMHQIRLFLKVSESGSFSKAAIRLNLPQPSISRSISRIESNTGVQLFERSGHGVQLTAAGERFREHARQIVYYHDRVFSEVQELHGQLHGEVRIATPESVSGVLFFPLIKCFQALHPNVRLQVMTSASVLIPGLLENNTVDIGIIADTHTKPAMSCEPLCREELHLIGPKTASETSQANIPLRQIESLPLILNSMSGGFRPIIDEAFAARKITPNVRIEVDANQPLLDLIMDGEGFSILPYSVIAGKSRINKLSAARIVSPTISRGFLLATLGSTSTTSACREAARQIRIIMHECAKEAKWIWNQ